MGKIAQDLIMGGEFADELVNDEEFAEFVLREAERTIVHATMEELAVFGFGTLEDAIEAYQKHLDAKENRS